MENDPNTGEEVTSLSIIVWFVLIRFFSRTNVFVFNKLKDLQAYPWLKNLSRSNSSYLFSILQIASTETYLPLAPVKNILKPF